MRLPTFEQARKRVEAEKHSGPFFIPDMRKVIQLRERVARGEVAAAAWLVGIYLNHVEPRDERDQEALRAVSRAVDLLPREST